MNKILLGVVVLFLYACSSSKNLVDEDLIQEEFVDVIPQKVESTDIGDRFGVLSDEVSDEALLYTPRINSEDFTIDDLIEEITNGVYERVLLLADELFDDKNNFNNDPERLKNFEFRKYEVNVPLSGDNPLYDCSRKGLNQILNSIVDKAAKKRIDLDKREIASAAEARDEFVRVISEGSMTSFRTSIEGIIQIQNMEMKNESVNNPCELISGIEDSKTKINESKGINRVSQLNKKPNEASSNLNRVSSKPILSDTKLSETKELQKDLKQAFSTKDYCRQEIILSTLFDKNLLTRKKKNEYRSLLKRAKSLCNN